MDDVEERSFVKRKIFIGFHLFIEAFLFPEVVALVLANEYGCTIREGLHLAWLSEPFGLKEQPSDNDCPVLKRVQDASSAAELKAQFDLGEDAFLKGSTTPASNSHDQVQLELRTYKTDPHANMKPGKTRKRMEDSSALAYQKLPSNKILRSANKGDFLLSGMQW